MSKIIKGVNYAVRNGATVLNLSLGGNIESRAFRQALANAYHSAVIVAAAGNSHYNLDDPFKFELPSYPAAWSFVLGVQATQQDGELAGFSNYDPSGPNSSPAVNKDALNVEALL